MSHCAAREGRGTFSQDKGYRPVEASSGVQTLECFNIKQSISLSPAKVAGGLISRCTRQFLWLWWFLRIIATGVWLLVNLLVIMVCKDSLLLYRPWGWCRFWDRGTAYREVPDERFRSPWFSNLFVLGFGIRASLSHRFCAYCKKWVLIFIISIYFLSVLPVRVGRILWNPDVVTPEARLTEKLYLHNLN